MPSFIGDQSNQAYWIGYIKQLRLDLDQLQVQVQYLSKMLGGTSGVVYIENLPTTNPHSAGQLWNSSGTVMQSAG